MKTPKGFLAEALKQARMDAQQTGVGISMYYDEDGRDIVACFTETGAELWRINLLGEKPRKAGEEDARTDYEKLARQKITLKFFPVFPEQVTFSSGSSSSSSLEIPAISFHPDSGSTPVRIVLKVDGQDEITHIPDPFSGYGFTSKSPSAGDSQ
jgi:hypothetical protein